jgi:ABC-type multidrug transport system ATPase subunit
MVTAAFVVDVLSYAYGRGRMGASTVDLAVDRLYFMAERGEILGLLGPNGAGKSTTLLCLAGLLRPREGTISFDGQVLGPERTRQVSLIPETPEVYGMLTVWEHLVFVARSCRLGAGWRARAEELLERLSLAEQRDTLGEALSKGMRQKTLIAATVLARAPVLLLDEPMIGHDPRAQRELRVIMHELRDAGTVILMSTHLLEQAEAISDRLLILQAGRAVASGTIDELRASAVAGGTLEEIFLDVTGGVDIDAS